MTIAGSVTPIEIRNGMLAIVSLLAAAVCLSYTFTNQRRKAKKPIYAATAMLFIILTVVFSIAVAMSYVPVPNWLYYSIRAGWLTVIIVILLIVAFVANVLADWRRNDQ